jgi:hypothetical protein
VKIPFGISRRGHQVSFLRNCASASIPPFVLTEKFFNFPLDQFFWVIASVVGYHPIEKPRDWNTHKEYVVHNVFSEVSDSCLHGFYDTAVLWTRVMMFLMAHCDTLGSTCSDPGHDHDTVSPDSQRNRQQSMTNKQAAGTHCVQQKCHTQTQQRTAVSVKPETEHGCSG